MRGGEAAEAGGSSLSWCTVGCAGGVAGFKPQTILSCRRVMLLGTASESKSGE